MALRLLLLLGTAWSSEWSTEEVLRIEFHGRSRSYLMHTRQVHWSQKLGPFPLIFNFAPPVLSAEQQNFVTGDFSLGRRRFSDIMDMDFADQNFILITVDAALQSDPQSEVELLREIWNRTRQRFQVGDIFAVGFRRGAATAWAAACGTNAANAANAGPRLRALAAVHGAPEDANFSSSCTVPPALVFSGDQDPQDVLLRRTVRYYRLQMSRLHPSAKFVSKITFCNNTVTCETSSTICGEGRVMLCYAKSTNGCNRSSCCLNGLPCDVSFAQRCGGCAAYDVWAGANCAQSNAEQTCVGTSAADVHTTQMVLDFFADYVRIGAAAQDAQRTKASQPLWDARKILSKLRAGFDSWGLLVSSWVGQRCYPGANADSKPSTVLRRDLPVVTLRNFGVVYQPLADPDAPSVRCFYPYGSDEESCGERNCQADAQVDREGRRDGEAGFACFTDLERGIRVQKELLKSQKIGPKTLNRAIIASTDGLGHKELLGFFWAHPASVTRFQSDEDQTLCCDIPGEWKEYIRNRWLPIVDITTSDLWTSTSSAGQVIKLVSEENYQRIIHQCAGKVIQDPALCLGCT